MAVVKWRLGSIAEVLILITLQDSKSPSLVFWIDLENLRPTVVLHVLTSSRNGKEA